MLAAAAIVDAMSVLKIVPMPGKRGEATPRPPERTQIESPKLLTSRDIKQQLHHEYDDEESGDYREDYYYADDPYKPQKVPNVIERSDHGGHSGYGYGFVDHGGYPEYGGYSKGGDCCPLVVDPTIVITLLGFIIAATYFLNIAITMNIPPGRRKRKKRSAADYNVMETLFLGRKEKGDEKAVHRDLIFRALKSDSIIETSSSSSPFCSFSILRLAKESDKFSCSTGLAR